MWVRPLPTTSYNQGIPFPNRPEPRKKKTCSFHCTGCSIGVLISWFDNNHHFKWVGFNHRKIPQTAWGPFFHCSFHYPKLLTLCIQYMIYIYTHIYTSQIDSKYTYRKKTFSKSEPSNPIPNPRIHMIHHG